VRSLAVARLGAKLLLADPVPIVVTVLMPLLFSAFLLPGARAELALRGVVGARGGEQLIPGMAVLFAFLGSALPGWAQAIAHVTPAYWALDALGSITLGHAGLGDVWRPIAVLAAFTAGFAIVAALRFRASDSKVGTT
jgi:ABC-2 type transport system permease protein